MTGTIIILISFFGGNADQSDNQGITVMLRRLANPHMGHIVEVETPIFESKVHARDPNTATGRQTDAGEPTIWLIHLDRQLIVLTGPSEIESQGTRTYNPYITIDYIEDPNPPSIIAILIGLLWPADGRE